MLKKILSVLICAAMVLAIMPVAGVYAADSLAFGIGLSYVFRNTGDSTLNLNTNNTFNYVRYDSKGNVLAYGWDSSKIGPGEILKITSIRDNFNISSINSNITYTPTTIPVYKKIFVERGTTYSITNTTNEGYNLFFRYEANGYSSEIDYVIYDVYDAVVSYGTYGYASDLYVDAGNTVKFTSRNSAIWVSALYDQFTVKRETEPVFTSIRIPYGDSYSFTNVGNKEYLLYFDGSCDYELVGISGEVLESENVIGSRKISVGATATITASYADVTVKALADVFTAKADIENKNKENILSIGDSAVVNNNSADTAQVWLNNYCDYVVYDGRGQVLDYGWDTRPGYVQLAAGGYLRVTAREAMFVDTPNQNVTVVPSTATALATEYLSVGQTTTMRNESNKSHIFYINTDWYRCTLHGSDGSESSYQSEERRSLRLNLEPSESADITAIKANTTITYLREALEYETPDVEVDGVSLNKSAITMDAGESQVVTATVTPANATNKDIIWSSSDESVATVSDGRITAVAPGEATITVTTSEGGFSADCLVTVNATSVTVESVVLNRGRLDLYKGETGQLTASVMPPNATDKSVTWSSGNTSIAKVDSNGLVTAVGNGSTTITVTTRDGGLSDECYVVVTTAVTGISLNRSSATVIEGESLTLNATVSPSDATNKTVSWRSSNTDVATVADGVVKAVSIGTATITVTTADGNKTATCDITVTPKPVPVESVALDKALVTLTEGEEAELTAVIVPANATNQNVSWSSSDTAVATVKNGVITAVKAGTATVTVTTEDGNKTAVCAVTVKAKEVIPAYIADLTVGTVDGGIGEEVTVPFTMNNNPGIAGINLTINYDKTKLVPVSVNSGPVLQGVVSNIQQGGNMENYDFVTAYWDNASSVTSNGQLFSVTFKVTQTSEEGLTPVTVSYSYGDVTNQDYDDIGLNIVNGGVNVFTPVTSVAINKTTLSLPVGASEKLVASVLPENATDRSVVWSSSDESIVTVQNGVITAVAPGNAVVYVASGDGRATASCEVKVTVPVTGITLDIESAVLPVGNSLTLKHTVLPSNATNKNVRWRSSNTSVATVEDGVVTTVSSGEVVITVTTEDGSYIASCEISVPAAEADLTVNSIIAGQGETVEVPIVISNNPGIAAFSLMINYDKSKLVPVAVKAGSAIAAGAVVSNIQQGGSMESYDYVTAYWDNATNFTENGEIIRVSFTVKENAELGITPIEVSYEKNDVTNERYENISLNITNGIIEIINPITGVSLNKSALSLSLGHSETLIATIRPKSVTYRKAAWSSSNTAVATVDNNGVVTAVGVGTAVITASCGGFSAKCSVTVSSLLMGDVYEDGVVDAKDGLKLRRYLAKWQVNMSDRETAAADVYSDTLINSKDGVRLRQYLAGWNVILGAQTSSLAAAVPVELMDVSALSAKPMAAEGSGIVFRIGQAQVEPGGYVEVPVEIVENSGVAAMQLRFDFDSDKLTPVAVIGNGIFAGVLSNVQQGEDTVYDAVQMYWDNPINVTDTGLAFTIRFKAIENIAVGEEISVTFGTCDILDQDFGSVEADAEDGSVTVVEDTPEEPEDPEDPEKPGETEPTGKVSFEAMDVDASLNEYVDVPVYLTENGGVSTFTLSLTYDKTKLAPVSVTLDKKFVGGIISDFETEDGAVIVSWENPHNVYTEGRAFVVRFKVIDGVGTETAIGLKYNEGDIFDQDMNDLEVSLAGSNVKIFRTPYTVNSADLTANGAKVTVTKNTDEYGDALLIVAGYKDGALAGIWTDNMDMEKGSTETISCELKGEFDTVKVFIWNSLNGMKPISESVVK